MHIIYVSVLYCISPSTSLYTTDMYINNLNVQKLEFCRRSLMRFLLLIDQFISVRFLHYTSYSKISKTFIEILLYDILSQPHVHYTVYIE